MDATNKTKAKTTGQKIYIPEIRRNLPRSMQNKNNPNKTIK